MVDFSLLPILDSLVRLYLLKSLISEFLIFHQVVKLKSPLLLFEDRTAFRGIKL